MSSDLEPKRRGRPPKAEGERKAGNLTIRTYGPLRAQLEEAARQSGRSVSAEVEYRLEQSFWALNMKERYEKQFEEHLKGEMARNSPSEHLKRIEKMCGGYEGLDFAVLIGNLLRRAKMKLGLPPEGDVLDLPESDRRALMQEVLADLPALFSLWDEASGRSHPNAAKF